METLVRTANTVDRNGVPDILSIRLACPRLPRHHDEPRYRQVFPTRLAPYRQALQDFITTRQGYRLAASTGGVLTGSDANIIVIDVTASPPKISRASKRRSTIMKITAARISFQAILASLTVAMLFVVSDVTKYINSAIIGQAHARDKGCSLEILRGPYAIYGQGNVFVGTPKESQEVDVGLINYDGNGGFLGSSTFSLNGKILRTKFTGTYRVNSDCISTAVLTDDLGEVLHEEGVILGDGVEVRFIGTDPGAVIARVARRLQ